MSRLWFAIFLVIALLGLVWFYPPSQDFSPENPFWNGLKQIATRSPLAPKDLSTQAALILIPYRPLTEEEEARVTEYVRKGGRLILFDDFGHGNRILETLGLGIRFRGEPLLDPLFNYRNPHFPRIKMMTGKEVVLNRPTALEGVPKEAALASSSAFSFLDKNDNSIWDEGEEAGPFPIAAEIAVGKGRVIIIGDPSLLINDMLGLGENGAFLKEATAGLPVFIYRDSLPMGAAERVKGVLEEGRERLASPWGIFLLLLIALPLSLKTIWKRRG